MQTTNRLLMVRPVCFAFNEETATNNAFQQRTDTAGASLDIQRKAEEEFDAYVNLLRANGVIVDVIQDTPQPFTPDSIFPNNCFSTHTDKGGRVLVLYPMFAPNRRKERKKLLAILGQMSFDRVIDLTYLEQRQQFLEGTGSMVFDRENRLAFACISPRTHEEALKTWAEKMKYEYFAFESVDQKDVPIYHTNVMMHVGSHFAVVCLESIRDATQRHRLVQLLEKCGKEVVEISNEQMHHFAGNMLEVKNDRNEKFLVMSATARKSLTPRQIQILEQDVKILAPDIHTIETAGGGSARCMLAEIY